MKKHLMSTLLTGLLVAGSISPVMAASAQGGTRIAVLDSQAALLSSDVAKAALAKLQADLKPQRDKHEQLRREIKALDEKFQKEVATMSEKDKKSYRAQQTAKVTEFNSLLQQVQKRSQDAEQEVLNKLVPSLQAIVEDMRKAGEYDIILDRRSAVAVAPESDLTKRVVDRLNAVK